MMEKFHLIETCPISILDIYSTRHGGRMDESNEPKKIISLQWDGPWLNYVQRWKKKPKGEKGLLYSDIPRTTSPRRRSKFKHNRKFKQMRESMEPLSLIDQ